MGMLLGMRMQNFRKIAQWEICKNLGELPVRCQVSDEEPYYDKNLGSKLQI